MVSGETIEHWTGRMLRTWDSVSPEYIATGFTTLGLLVDGSHSNSDLVGDTVQAADSRQPAPITVESWRVRCVARRKLSDRFLRLMGHSMDILFASWFSLTTASGPTLLVLPRRPPWAAAVEAVVKILCAPERQKLEDFSGLCPAKLVGPKPLLESLEDSPALWKAVSRSSRRVWPDAERGWSIDLLELLRG